MKIDASTLKIVPLVESELASVIQIAEILEEAPHWSLDSYMELVSKNPPVPRISLVARDQQADEVVGFVIARLIPPDAELESIGASRGAQRLGVGSRVLQTLVKDLVKKGIESIHLEVRPSNAAAIAFYRTLGFAETGIRPRYYTDPVEDAVQMRLRLV